MAIVPVMRFDKLYEQILQMNDLKLIIFDPLASFVHADVNADPAQELP